MPKKNKNKKKKEKNSGLGSLSGQILSTRKDETVYKFRRSTTLFQNGAVSTTLTGSTSTYSSIAYYFCLNDLPSYTDFSNLFDVYRIAGVEVKMMPQVIAPNTSGASLGILYVAFDPDDNTAITVTQIQQRQNTKIYRPNQIVDLKFEPAHLDLIYAQSGSQESPTFRKEWMNSASPNVPYFGLKCVLSQSITLVNYYLVTLTYLVECKYPF
jgi:hypothetical protein